MIVSDSHWSSPGVAPARRSSEMDLFTTNWSTRPNVISLVIKIIFLPSSSQTEKHNKQDEK